MRKLIISLFVLCCINGITEAQTRIFDEKLSSDKDFATVSFKVDSYKGVPSRRKEVIMPYVYNGKDTLWFDALEVYGKGRYKRERQVNALNGDRNWKLGEYQTLKGDVYEYVSAVPLKRWMTSATLGIKRQLVGCACEKDILNEDRAKGTLLEVPMVQRRLPSYYLADVKRNWDFGQDELEIVFKVSKAEIDSSVFNNEVTFGKILTAVDRIFSRSDFRLDRIEVAGYASPEGPPDFNAWLGGARAEALIDYIIKHRPQYNITRDHFNIRNGEENWEGLRRVVAASDLDHRDEVLAIIDNDSIPSERRKLWIEKIDNGWVWKKMLDEIYPHLRCARYLAVYYESQDDSIIKAVIEANELVREGKYLEAYEALISYGEDPRTFNTIGVSLMMQKKFEEAMPWFEKAVNNGLLSARKNMDAIEAEYVYERQQRNEIEEYLKKYN